MWQFPYNCFVCVCVRPTVVESSVKMAISQIWLSLTIFYIFSTNFDSKKNSSPLSFIIVFSLFGVRVFFSGFLLFKININSLGYVYDWIVIWFYEQMSMSMTEYDSYSSKSMKYEYVTCVTCLNFGVLYVVLEWMSSKHKDFA